MQTLAVASHKGGVAKTTTTAYLGAQLARAGVRVLLVDLDAQASLTRLLAVDPSPAMADVLLGRAALADVAVTTADGPDLVPSDRTTAAAEAQLAATDGGTHALVRACAAAPASRWDVMLFDCPPAMGLATACALVATSAGVLVPVAPGYLGLAGYADCRESVRLVSAELNAGLRVLGVVVVAANLRHRVTRETGELLRAAGEAVLGTIPADTRVRGDALILTSRAGRAYRDLAAVVATRLELHDASESALKGASERGAA